MKILSQVDLDYGASATEDLLINLSGAAASDDALWTVSDEGRTVERLVWSASGYVFDRQIALDDHILNIPRRDKPDKRELDLEAIDIHGGRLWLCGSHSNVRKKSSAGAPPSTKIEVRAGRNFLASFALAADGATLNDPRALPFSGKGSLRARLEDDGRLKPFLDLASKEGGLDIEGFLAQDDRLFLGLRGPVIDGRAVVIELPHEAGKIGVGYKLHFLDLKGLAIRDLARSADGDILVLAGPCGSSESPYRLLRWRPGGDPAIEEPPLFTWPLSTEDSRPQEKPEGVCLVERRGATGYLVAYDNPDKSRIHKDKIYQADWLV